MKPHKHSELIKAWADGAEIQLRFQEAWTDCPLPQWFPDAEYRIKPQPKTDVVLFRWVYLDGSTSQSSRSNVKYTFDGETSELKSAEVLK